MSSRLAPATPPALAVCLPCLQQRWILLHQADVQTKIIRRDYRLHAGRLPHFEYANFVRGTETVLHRTQETIRMMPFSFKIKYAVHHMLQHTRTGDSTFFGNMPYKNRCNASAFSNPCMNWTHSLTCATLPGALVTSGKYTV